MSVSAAGKCCRQCGQTQGTVICNACDHHLCWKHLVEHRQATEKQCEELIGREKDFRETVMSKSGSFDDLFVEIDQWKRTAMDEIKQVAKRAKEELKQLICQSNERLVSMSKDVEANLQSIKQSDGICERQLDQVRQRLNELETKNSYRLLKSSCSHWLRFEKVEEPSAILPPSPSPCHPREVHSRPATGHCTTSLPFNEIVTRSLSLQIRSRSKPLIRTDISFFWNIQLRLTRETKT